MIMKFDGERHSVPFPLWQYREAHGNLSRVLYKTSGALVKWIAKWIYSSTILANARSPLADPHRYRTAESLDAIGEREA